MHSVRGVCIRVMIIMMSAADCLSHVKDHADSHTNSLDRQSFINLQLFCWHLDMSRVGIPVGANSLPLLPVTRWNHWTCTADNHPSADPCPALEGLRPGLDPGPAQDVALALDVGAKRKSFVNTRQSLQINCRLFTYVIKTVCIQYAYNVHTLSTLIAHLVLLFT